VRHAPVGNVSPTYLLLLAIATVLLRLPFLTPRLAHWDAVNYALGLHDFNVAAHQPHPPGSPYFILLGRAALALTGDDNTAPHLAERARRLSPADLSLVRELDERLGLSELMDRHLSDSERGARRR